MEDGVWEDGNMIRIIDSFCPQIDQVRDSFLASGYGTWKPESAKVGSGKYEGMSFMGEHHWIIAALTQQMGCPIIPNSMFARYTNTSTERAYIHSDRSAGAFTCITYLSDHKSFSGTAFYRHKETGLLEMPLEWMDEPQRAKEMVDGKEEDWDRLDLVRGLYNRAVIFSAPLFHSRYPMEGMEGEEDRAVHVVHFNLMS